MSEREFYNTEVAKLRDSLLEGKISSEVEVFNNYFFLLIGERLKDDSKVLDLGTGKGYVLKTKTICKLKC